MTRTDTPGKPPARPPDPRAKYFESISRWESSDRDHHRSAVACACGAGTTADLEFARALAQYDLANAIAAKGDAARTLVDLVRLAVEDECSGYTLRLNLLALLRPALGPVADRLADLEQRVADLEAVVAAGGAS